MKLARVLVLVFFLLSALTGAVSASAPAANPDRAVGFVQLLSRVDPNLPVQVQSNHAYQRVIGQLLAAQHRGQIVEFELSARTGVLKLVYRPSMGPLNIAGKTVQSTMKAAANQVDLPKLEMQRPGQAGDLNAACAPFFGFSLYDNYIYGECLPLNAKAIGTVRDASGRIVATYSGYVDATGYIRDYFHWSGSYTNIAPGHKVKVILKDPGTSAVLGTYIATVPSIKFTSVDKATSIVKGTATAGKTLYGNWLHYLRNSVDPYAEVHSDKSTIVSASGAWQIDFGTTPMHGNDDLDAVIYIGSNFGFDRYISVPYIYCELRSNYCGLHGIPSTAGLLQIVHGGVTYKFTGKLDQWGYLYGDLRKPDDSPIYLVKGDKISGTGVAQYALPNLTASINYDTDVVSGKAPANTYFWVVVYDVYSGSGNSQWVHADSLGNYSFTNGYDLVSGEAYAVEPWFAQASTGNVTDLYQSFGP